jgi:zinc protease
MSLNGFPLRSPVVERRLPNGLTVLVCEDRRAPVVAVITHVRAGYFDEADDVIGISHVLEHMYFKGTSRRGPGEIARETKALGGYLNAGTIYDHTSYYTVVPSEAVEGALDIQSDALCNAAIDADELSRELRVIIQEARRKLDTPGAVARETLFERMFDVHRIRRWRIGTESVLSRLTRADVERFYRMYYSAPNIVLSIAGDIDAARVLDRVEHYYGGMAAVEPVRDRGAAEPDHAEFRYHELEGDVHQSHIEWGWRTPGLTHEQTPALDLMSVILGQGRASRLYRGVREAGLATEIGAHNYTPDDIGIFGISAVCDPQDAEAALTAMLLEVERLRRHGVLEQELERARNIVLARLIRRFETVEGQATLLAEWQAQGDWQRVRTHYERMMAVRADELMQLAAMYLDPARAALLVYRPKNGNAVNWRPLSVAQMTAPAPTPAQAPATLHTRDATAHGVEDGVHFYDHPALGIVILPRREVPLVTISVAFAGGAARETPQTAGFTSLTCRTTMKGTRTRSAAGIAEEIEALGGNLAPAVAPDAFDWAVSLPSRHFERGLEILADITWNAAFPGEEVEREKKAALGEAQRLREDMHRYPQRLFLEAAFEGDAYGLPLTAWERAVTSAGDADLLAWHARTVRQQRATLLIAGDVDADAAASLAIAHVDAVAGPLATVAAESPIKGAPWPDAERERVVERQTAQTAMVLGFPGPARNDADTDALVVMAAAISGLGGPLFEELRSRRSLAYAVSAQPLARRRGGAFIAYIGTSPEREAEARSGLIEQLERWKEERLGATEVEAAKTYLLGSRRIRLQTNTARLGELAGAILLGRGVAELRDYEERVRAVTPERIREVAAKWLDRSRLVQGIVRGTGGSR